MTKLGISGDIGKSREHDSGIKHVTGEATYIDDINEPGNILYLEVGGSSEAHAKITRLDLKKVATAPGVRLVLTANDLPGINDVSPTGTLDDPVLAEDEVVFHGQPIFAVIAESLEQARAATKLAEIEYRRQPAILTIDDAVEAQSFISPTRCWERGDVASELHSADNTIAGRLNIGGQEHFYLEGHASLAIPNEDGDVLIHCSTQHPSEVQHNVAHVLGVPNHNVTIEVRRMGGGFGGKETQGAQWAALAAVAAIKTGRPVKVRLDRDDDMGRTGKRHDFTADYQIGFDNNGDIKAADVTYATRCGISADLSDAICDRAMFHTDNAYYLGATRIISHRCRTHTVSNTAFRGFGGPQGMLTGEWMIEQVARAVGKDPLTIRKQNFYGDDGRNETPYYMTVEDFILNDLIPELETSAEYWPRRKEIAVFNTNSTVIKRGLALTPVKFGISFTTTFLNQAGALVHVYRDGSVHLNHGGTEMGQGLFTKVAQIVAHEFQVNLEQVKITATNTGKVPNTSATAASSGTDMNGMAAQAAAKTIKQRLIAFAANNFDVSESDVVFNANRVIVGTNEMAFAELVELAYLNRVQLSATGFYRTPKIHWNPETGRGRPFYYFAYGAAVSEVAIDTLTGESRTLRTDILHDVGESLNPAIDLGQIEGGFVQGAGWLTSEELCWDEFGRLTTHAPSTYKIPTCGDRPEVFNIHIWESGRNNEATIHRSKAVGEPPLMLANSVFLAVADAVSSLSDYKTAADLHAPATPETILNAVNKMKNGRT